MNITRNALRSFSSRKTQAVFIILLLAIGTLIYTAIIEGNNAMYGSLTAYDASQNTEDYGFIPRNKLAEEQWQGVFKDYNIPDNVQADFNNGLLDSNTLIRQYRVNLYAYQRDFIARMESTYDLTVETSFNKMLTNEINGHQYRVFTDSGSIDKPYIVAGSLPAAANEVTILPEYAKYNNLNIGDILEVNGVNFIISGFVYHPAYITPIVTTNVVKETSIYYPDTQSILFMTEDALYQLDGETSFAYKSKSNQILTRDEKIALFNKLYDTNDFEILDNAVNSITHGETYTRVNSLAAVIGFMSILICGSCMFVSAQIIKRRIDADKKQIGTLKSLGYKSWEIARSYSAFAVVISALGSAIGCVAGYFAYRPLIVVMNRDFNLPVNNSPDYTTFICAFAFPVILLVVVSMITALLMLNKPPIDLIRDNSDSKINALGRFVTRIFSKAPFEIRAKYQIACRSISKLSAMFLIGLLASTMLLVGFIMNSAFSGMAGKIFAGVNVDSFVTFNSTYSINDRQPQYEDEEAALLKDLTIQEIRYKNGKTLTLDEADKRQAEIIGVNPDSAYIDLVNENGERINNDLAGGLIINKVVQGKYGLNIGDYLLLNNTHENIEVEIEIIGIADQYSGYLAYTDKNLLTDLFGYANGSYNSVFTNHQYQLSDARINKVLTISDFEDGLESNLQIFNVLSVFIMILAIVIAFVLISISANLVIEENSKSISTFKVLGYSDREISNLVVDTYTPLIIIGYLLALPISIRIMGILKAELETKFDLPMMLSLGVLNALLGFAALMITYFAGLHFSKRHIDRIALAESLDYNA